MDRVSAILEGSYLFMDLTMSTVQQIFKRNEEKISSRLKPAKRRLLESIRECPVQDEKMPAILQSAKYKF